MPQNLAIWADGFNFSLKEVVLLIFIELKYTSVSAGFEPANIGSSGKHGDNYTTENN
jgi:hypothetical protein